MHFQTSADILPIDVEAILNKTLQYFHVCTVRVEELKEFCEVVDVEYKQILEVYKSGGSHFSLL
jgi:hypothetical protein